MMAEAPTPAVYENAPFMGVSKSGEYAVSNMLNSMVTIVNTKDNTFTVFYDDDEVHQTYYLTNEYMPGFGTCVANDGSVVGNAVLYDVDWELEEYTQTDHAVVFTAGGEIVKLPVFNEEYPNTAHSITPDGSMICGSIGSAPWDLETTSIMQLPVVWYRQDDGTYSEPEILPHPETDYLGATPQYVTALCMSEDGNTVAGLVTAGSGWVMYPIVYQRDAEGQWSYTLPHPELYYTHPEVEIPENPGDYPDLEDYMTQEEIDAYNQAMQDWIDAGGDDWANYPYLENYATEEELAAYNAAVDQWWIDTEAYGAAVEQATEGAITFVFNNMALSPDGKYMGVTAEASNGGGIMWKPGLKSPKHNPAKNLKKKAEGEEEPGMELLVNTPFVFDIEADTYQMYDSEAGMQVNCAGKDGKFLGYSGSAYMPESIEPCVLDPENGVVRLIDYVAGDYPEISQWMNDNMTHTVLTYEYDVDLEQYVEVEKECTLVGIPFCSPDFSVITTYVDNLWDYSDEAPYYYGYIFKFPEWTGVGELNIAAPASMAAQRGGIVKVSDTALVEVFTMDGTCVFRTRGQGSINTGLGKGIYVVRATFADGASKLVKTSF